MKVLLQACLRRLATWWRVASCGSIKSAGRNLHIGAVPARPLGRRFESAARIREHELRIEHGEFRFSERGYGHWLVKPGDVS